MNGRIRLLYKSEHRIYITYYGTGCRHQHIIRIHACISLMEVPCTDTSNIASRLHSDMGYFGMDFQPFHPKNHMNACILHFFGPIDIGCFIKTCQEFDYYSHLLTVPCSTNQRFHHFRFFCQTVKSRLYTLDILTKSRLLKHTDIVIKTMERYMDISVLLLNKTQQTHILFQFRLQYRKPARIFQIATPAIGKSHQVFMIMISPSAKHSIQLIQIQAIHHPL